MTKRLIGGIVGAASLLMVFGAPAAADPEVPNPPANPPGVAAGIGCDMGKFHSETAKAGGIGKNKGHYPGQHKGASVCK